MRPLLTVLLLALALACHPEYKAQREAALQSLVAMVSEVQEGREPEPLPYDLSRYGRHAGFLTFVHPRLVKVVALEREVQPLIRASMAWMDPHSWTSPAEITRCRTEADRLLGILAANEALQEETFGAAGQREIDALEVPAVSREAFRKGLQEAYARNALLREFESLYRDRTRAQREVLAFLEGHLERMDELRPIFPSVEEAQTYRQRVGEEKRAMARVQEKLASVAAAVRELRSRQRDLVESMKER